MEYRFFVHRIAALNAAFDGTVEELAPCPDGWEPVSFRVERVGSHVAQFALIVLARRLEIAAEREATAE